jgi:hypothetical protein
VHSNPIDGAALNVRVLQRQLAALLPEARVAGEERTLELASPANDAPRLISATVIEGAVMRAHTVESPSGDGFQAFLDGTQRSEVASYLGTIPVILGHVAAVVRERSDRRLRTWDAPLVERSIYVPRAFLPAVTWDTLLARFGPALVDVTDGAADVASHPFALRDAAVHRVQAHRERVEQVLAERWCGSGPGMLYIDGGISGSEKVAVSAKTVGVVKSHRTLYAEGPALGVVLGLAHRERSSVFRITSPKRTTVASWYLRLRDPAGHDPMWGLVRVEVAYPDSERFDTIGARADEVSRWILGEVSPLALPDARWDKMVYGVRDCEEFLRAIQ